jgi:hypothetical protein
MSGYALSKDDGESQAARFLTEAYFRRESQAELVVPYSFPTEVDETLIGAVQKTRMHRYLIDIDGPWLITFFLSIFTSGILPIIVTRLGLNHTLAIISAVALWPFLLLPIYWTVAGFNFRARYGKQWLRTIMGPTHLGLSATGLKCYWKGKFFYNYPLLRSWPNVRRVELVLPAQDDLGIQASILISFVGRFVSDANISLPLSGFNSRTQLLAFLNCLNKYLPDWARTESFTSESESAFQRTLEYFDQSKRWEIELKQ